MKWKPSPRQKKALKHLYQLNRAGLFAKPGVGKTSTGLGAILTLLQAKLTRGVLIVAPLRVVYDVWPAERDKWDDFRGLSVAVLHGPHKDARLFEKHDIYLINPEGLHWLATALSKMKVWPFDLLLLDESTKFKHARTQRFALLDLLLPGFPRRWIFTGTPAANSLENLFAQMMVLDGGLRLGRFITHFRRKFGDITRRTSKGNPKGWMEWTPAPDAHKRIQRAVSDICLYLPNAPGELPERHDRRVGVPLPLAVLKQYRKLEREYVAIISGKSVSSPHAGAVRLKLQQVVSGSVYTDDGDVAFVHGHKLVELQRIASLDKSPLLVGVQFKHEVAAIRKHFKDDDMPYLGDGIGAARASEIVRQFNAGKLPMLLVNPQSAAHGLNLQEACSTMVWFSLTWDFEMYDQLCRRIWRRGQENAVIVYHLVAGGTIDDMVLSSLLGKNETQEEFFRRFANAHKNQATAY